MEQETAVPQAVATVQQKLEAATRKKAEAEAEIAQLTAVVDKLEPAE